LSTERFAVLPMHKNTLQHFQRGQVPPLAHVCGRACKWLRSSY